MFLFFENGHRLILFTLAARRHVVVSSQVKPLNQNSSCSLTSMNDWFVSVCWDDLLYESNFYSYDILDKCLQNCKRALL